MDKNGDKGFSNYFIAYVNNHKFFFFLHNFDIGNTTDIASVQL